MVTHGGQCEGVAGQFYRSIGPRDPSARRSWLIVLRILGIEDQVLLAHFHILNVVTVPEILPIVDADQ